MENKFEVITELTNKEIEEALSSDLKGQWAVFKTLTGDNAFQQLYDQVRYGVELKFDIRFVTNGFVELKPEHGVAQIARKQKEDITDYWNELDEREEIMKDVLRSKYDNTFDKQHEINMEGFDDK